MKLADWRAGVHAPPREPTPRGAQENIVLAALSGRVPGPRRRRLAVLIAFLLVVAALQPRLSRSLARFAPPIAATGEFLMQTSGRWNGHEIFPVDRSSVLLAAIADGAWPTPARAWPEARALPIGPDLYALGPDHTGAVMYYAVPGPAGHSAWLASPGPDGKWSSGAEDPRAVAARIDALARQFEVDTLARLARGEPGGPWGYNVRWGDDHIVLFREMLLARGRHDAVRARLAADPTALRAAERLDLPGLWGDQAAAAAALLAAIQSPTPAPALAGTRDAAASPADPSL